MFICAISDTHGAHNTLSLPDADILIHAGDWTRSRVHCESETVDFINWMQAQNHTHKIIIPGNHDLYAEAYPNEMRKLCVDNNIHYLVDSAVTIQNTKFYGTPWTPIFYDWYFMGTAGELKAYFSLIPADTAVLITHGPPFGILDKVSRGEWVGSKELLKRLPPNLKAHIFGHIHEQYGTQGMFVNASIMTVNYKPTNKPILLEI